MAGGDRLEGEKCKYPASYFIGGLFHEFEALDIQVRKFDKAEKPVVRLGDQKLVLSYRHQSDGYEEYSRTTKTKIGDNQWITVQIREINYGFATDRRLNIFGDRANLLASLDSDADFRCVEGTFAIVISKQDKDTGKDAIIRGALRAVAGTDIPVTVLDK